MAIQRKSRSVHGTTAAHVTEVGLCFILIVMTQFEMPVFVFSAKAHPSNQRDLMIIRMFYVKCGSIKRTFTYVFTGTKTYNTDVFSASKRINTYVFSAFKR